MESGKVRKELGGRYGWALSLARITDAGPRHPEARSWEALAAQPAAQGEVPANEPF